MQNYSLLLKQLGSPKIQQKFQVLKKLIYLSVHDKNNFVEYIPDVIKSLAYKIYDMIQQQSKILSLQFITEITMNYTGKIPVQYYCFNKLMLLLSDPNAQIRKASHYLILIYIKKHSQIDQILQNYLICIHNTPNQWKIHQKIIHSFQSLLVIQPVCISYCKNFIYLDNFINVLLANRYHQHALIKKASEQTLQSFIKNQYASQILHKLHKEITKQLLQYPNNKKIHSHPSVISPKQKNKKGINISQQQINRCINNNIMGQIIQQYNKQNQVNQQSNEQSNWQIKVNSLQKIYNGVVQGWISVNDDIIDKILDMVYDYNFNICIKATHLLYNIITQYPQKITNKYKQIEQAAIDKISDLKQEMRVMIVKILTVIYKNRTKQFYKKMMIKLGNCSIIGKQQIFDFFQNITMIDNDEDLQLVLNEVVNQIDHQNDKIKNKSIICLINICLRNDVDVCKQIIKKKLNNGYYQMFMEKLNNRIEVGCQENQTVPTKGMAWQVCSPITEQSLSNKAKPKITFKNSKLVKDKIKSNNKKILEDCYENKQIKKFGRGQCRTSRTYKSLYNNINNNINYNNNNNNKNVNYNNSKNKNNIHNKLLLKKNEIMRSNNSFVDEIDYDEIKYKGNQKITSIKLTSQTNNILNKQKLQQIPIIQSSSHKILRKAQKQQNKSSTKQKKLHTFSTSQKYPKPLLKHKKNSKQQQTKSTFLQQQNKIILTPLSLKKQTIKKKQHIIDYKATNYQTHEQLLPVDHPKQVLEHIFNLIIGNLDWKKQFDNLDLLRRIIKNHQDCIPIINQNLPIIMPQLLKLLQSLRSCVTKNAMITLSQMCEVLQKSMDPYLQLIFTKLFKKSLDTNTFIGEQVKKCIESLCRYCSLNKICVIVVNNSNSKAMPIKLNILYCMSQILQKNEYNSQVLRQNPKIISVLSEMVMDGAWQVRSMVREIFIKIIQKSQQDIQELFIKNCGNQAWDKWKDIIQKQSSGNTK